MSALSQCEREGVGAAVKGVWLLDVLWLSRAGGLRSHLAPRPAMPRSNVGFFLTVIISQEKNIFLWDITL